MTTDTGCYQALQRYSLNTLGRDLVVGDVHGCFSLLDAALKGLEFDPMRDRLFSVGDRGRESPAVLDAVRRHQIKAVRGNHEQMILDWAMNGAPEHVRAHRAYLADPQAKFDPIVIDVSYRKGTTSALIDNGGEWFIELNCREDETDNYKAQHIVDYFTSMPLAIEIETAHDLMGIVHAGVPIDTWSSLRRALAHGENEMCKTILWDRRRWKGRAVPDYIADVTAVIVGHSPTYDVAQCGNVIDIDTGAVYGNKLTILNLADVPEWLARGDRTITETQNDEPASRLRIRRFHRLPPHQYRNRVRGWSRVLWGVRACRQARENGSVSDASGQIACTHVRYPDRSDLTRC